MRCGKVLLLTTIVLFSLFSVLESPTGSEGYGSTSTYLYSFAHLSEPEVDLPGGRVQFENQTKWLAQPEQDHIKAVVITGGFMGEKNWYNLTAGTVDETVWGWVEEGIERLQPAGKVVIPVLGDYDAFYNQSYDGVKSDYRTFLQYTGAKAPNYTVTLNETIKLFFVTLSYQWFGLYNFTIPDAQVTWLGEKLNSTSLPAIIALHSPPTKYASSFRDSLIKEAVWTEASRHSNVFLILHGHDHERNFRIYEAGDGHPIHVEGKLVRWASGGQAEIQIYDVYSDRIKSYTFSPLLNKNLTGFEGDTFEIPFRGIMKSRSGLLKRNDFSSRQGSETGQEYRIPKLNYDDFISPPSSVDMEFFDFVKRLIPKHHKTFWLQTQRKFDDRGGGDINFWQIKGIEQLILSSDTKVIGESLNFYPNMSDTSKNVTVSTSDWYSVIYSIDEIAQVANVSLFFGNGTLVRSWFDLPYISVVEYGKKDVRFIEFVRMDDYIVANGTEVTFPEGTTLTLSNGTKIFPDGSLDLLLDFGTLVLMNVTVQIGMESAVMDLYGGDAVIVDYLDFWPSPVALFTSQPSKPLVNEPVTFNASDSRDLNGWIVSYTWDFDDGNITTVYNKTDTVYWLINHSFTMQGKYAVTLSVTDNEDLNSSKTIYIDVIHAHDVAVTNVTASPQTVITGEPVSVRVSVMNEGANNENFSVIIFYNVTAFETEDVSLGMGMEKNLTFVWDTANVAVGTYNMGAQVTGVDGEIDLDDNIYFGDTVTVAKLNSTVSILVSPQVLNFGENVTITGGLSPLRRGVNVTIMYRRPPEVLYWDILTNVSTDIDGSFRYDWMPQPGSSYVKARWAGDDKTSDSDSVVLLIIVHDTDVIQDGTPPPNYLMYAIVGTIITIVAASVLIYFVRVRKRRKI